MEREAKITQREIRAQLRLVALRARVAVRVVRGLLRRARPVVGWDEPVTPVVLPGRQVLELRHPRPADARAWLALRRTWGVPRWRPVQGPWVVSSTRLAWVRHCRRVLGLARRGLAQPYLVFLDGRLQGQVEVGEVDLGTSSGEVVSWLPGLEDQDGTGVGTEVAEDAEAAAVAAVALRAFDGPGEDVDRLVLPLPAEAGPPPAALARLGFVEETVLRSFRRTGLGRLDHHQHVLHRSDAVLARLRHELGRALPADRRGAA